jgi:hypothetical protein
MKPAWTWTLLLIVALSISSCGILNRPAPAEATEGPQPYPQGGGAAPLPSPTFVGGVAYPELSDGDEIRWEQAVGMIQSGLVTKAVQTHDLKVYVTIFDGRTFVTTEPAIDDVMRVIEACGDYCKSIQVATE